METTDPANSTPPPAPPADAPVIKLVALDLDGTLLTDEKNISHSTIRALARLNNRGVKVVLATARPPRSVKQIYNAIALDTLMINYNGAVIWDEPNRRTVFHRPMTGQLVRAIIDRARMMFDEVLVTCEILDRWFTDRVDQSFTTETGKLFQPDFIGPLDQFCNQDVTKLLLLGPDYMVRQLATIVDIHHGKQVAWVTDSNMLQIMDHRVSKAVALQTVAEHYGVAMKNVMAIGDAPNDVAMLQVSGVGVAVDNAHPRVKEVATWIAPSNNDHGVHAALRRYGLTD